MIVTYIPSCRFCLASNHSMTENQASRTLRRILRRLGLSYSKPRPVPHKTAPMEEQNMFKERMKRTILGVARLFLNSIWWIWCF